ncbi:MAG: EamA family transporter [Desulfobacteraceae bacterium 4572_130]|nr:MAG: EamA family transporter [Desulfobacteraceae bacterium 4572_130]
MNKNKYLELMGCFCIFGSAFFFYFATVFIKWAKMANLLIDPSFFVFFRFSTGFILVCIIMYIKKTPPKPVKLHYLLGRTFANCIAVYCFFVSINLTSVAEANILNMTYPLFIALISWFFLKVSLDKITILIVITAFLGIWLIIAPSNATIKIENFWGLLSGISASFSIIYLNLSRKVHDTETILFFLFGIGSITMLVLFHDKFFIPNPIELKYLTACSIFSIAGQYLITIGFKYVTALEGGILSSSRILLAALLEHYLTSDPALSLSGWIGAFLVFGSNVYLTVKKIKY